MRKLILAIALAASAAALAAAPAELDAKALASGAWYAATGPGARDELRFFTISPADAGRLYLRRFSTPSYYLDALAGSDLKVLLWPEPKALKLSFSADGSAFARKGDAAELSYRRSSARPAGAAASAYEGDWSIGELAMAASVRACETRAWELAMYFPGDPLSAIPMGYYPLYAVGDGTFRSSSAFADSLVELEYDQASDSLVLRPLFKQRPLAAELYYPVHAWRDK